MLEFLREPSKSARWKLEFPREPSKSALWRVIPAPNLGFRPPGPKIVQIGSIRTGFACGNSGAPETGIPAPKLRIRPTGPKIVRIGPNRIGFACGHSGAPETAIPAPKLRLRPTGPKFVRIGPNRIGFAWRTTTAYKKCTSAQWRTTTACKKSIQEARQYTAHSAKLTLISLATLAGEDPSAVCLQGGWKTPQGASDMQFEYSRESMLVPLHMTARIIRAVREGVLDATKATPTSTLTPSSNRSREEGCVSHRAKLRVF